MGVGFYWVKLFFTDKKKFVAISIIMVVGFLFLWLIIGMGSPSKTQNVVKKQEATKPDVAGIKTIQPTDIPIPTNGPTPNTDSRQIATLVKLVDGDTIAVSVNGKNETVRIIGIDTPEVIDPRKTVECFGKEASEFARITLQDNKNLLLESDPTQGDRDKYNRLLRYVWTDDVTDFGKLMIESGYASEYTYDLPYKYQKVYKEAEGKALEAKKGLWVDNACISVNATEGDKDCSDFKVQDEAQTYFEGKGGSSMNNVDRLDSDHDGLACESLP